MTELSRTMTAISSACVLALALCVWASPIVNAETPRARDEVREVPSTGRWELVKSPTQKTLNSVDMVSSDAGWAVGEGGVILKWDGRGWTEVTSPVNYNSLKSVDMLSADEGWAVGFWTAIHWDGRTWSAQPTLEDFQLETVSMISESDGWAGGAKFERVGQFPQLRTLTARWDGRSWREVNGPNLISGRIQSISALNEHHAWATGFSLGDGLTLYWDSERWLNTYHPTAGDDVSINSVATLASDDIWAAGGNGRILHFNGLRWDIAGSPITNTLNSIDMTSARDGWAVGVDGRIIHWDGTTWASMTSPVTETLTSVSFVSPGEGWAVGSGGTILHYTDPNAPTPLPMPSSTTAASATSTRTPTLAPTPTAKLTPTSHPLYLPILARHWPPLPYPPVLKPIDNGAGDRFYSIIWEASYLSEYYRLEEDDGVAFGSPAVKYAGADKSLFVSGQQVGTWYYRVQGCNAVGCGGWSEVRAVTVLPPTPTPIPVAEVYIDNRTGGNLCYEIRGSGIGRKCSSDGDWLYGTFPPGRYTWKASARCGSISGERVFDSTYTHQFWCSQASTDADQAKVFALPGLTADRLEWLK